MFPGISVAVGVELGIPLTEGNAIVIEGVKSSATNGSEITGTMQVPDVTAGSVEFKYLAIDSLETLGGSADIKLTECVVNDILEAGGDFTGTLWGYDSSFGVLTSLPTATVRLKGGNVLQLTGGDIYLNDLYVGSAELLSGDITAHADGEDPAPTIYCENVTFIAGSTVTFDSAGIGDIYLDGPSYKSFLDNNITLVNGHIVRSDGSWPQDAIAYASVAGAAEAIDFAKNPRAILEYDTSFVLTFTAPLTREVQILLINTDTGGPIDWPANVKWSDGTPPDFPTVDGAETLLRFDYEETLDFYYGWVALMDAQVEP
jgi:hypothetical protein